MWLPRFVLTEVLTAADISTVSEGALHVAGALQLPYGGRDVDQVLRRMLAKRGVEGLDDAAIHLLKDSGARLVTEAPGDQVGASFQAGMHV